MREKTIEEKLTKEIKNLGGLCWKFTVPGISGVPDRIILLNNKVFFVETKAPGKKPRPLQQKMHRDMAQQGFPVYIINTIDQINTFIKEIQNG